MTGSIARPAGLAVQEAEADRITASLDQLQEEIDGTQTATMKWQIERYRQLPEADQASLRVIQRRYGPWTGALPAPQGDLGCSCISWGVTVLALLATVGIVLMERKVSPGQVLAGRIVGGVVIGVSCALMGYIAYRIHLLQVLAGGGRGEDLAEFNRLMGPPPAGVFAHPRLMPGVLDRAHDGQVPAV